MGKIEIKIDFINLLLSKNRMMIDDNEILNTLDEIGNRTKYCPVCKYTFKQRQGLILHIHSIRHKKNRKKMEEKEGCIKQ